jgi:O-antigen/teichoic acid export membrane protein
MIFFLLTTFDVAVMMICRAAGFQARDLGFVAIGRVANLALNALLIPIMGAMGAAIATALTVLVLLALRWQLVARNIVRISWHRFTLMPFVTSTCLAAVFMPLAGRLPVVAVALAYAGAYLAIAFAFFPALAFVRRAFAARAGAR